MITKLKSNLQLAVVSAFLVGGFGVFALAPPVAAFDEGLQDGANAAQGTDQDGSAASLFEDDGIFQTVTNVLLFIIGAIAVIMLVIGGIRYTVSNGDATAVKSAKDTILYAIIGIIVAILAYAAVDFVIDSFAGP